jgi:nascent polypeptide-associated complex subunit alpha
VLPLSPHEFKKLLKRYGINVEDIKGVEKVEIHLPDKVIVITSPQVLAFKTSKQIVFQVVGEEILEEQRSKPTVTQEAIGEVKISEDDVKFIVEYTGVTPEKAREALIKARGDIARAIMLITSGESK